MRWVLLLVPLLLLALAVGLRPAPTPPPRARLALQEVLGAPAEEGYARALQPRAFRFPADHGPHPEFSAEWWYFTGNLQGPDGRPFGYQLTFFRKALSPRPVRRTSAWAASQAWMAHLALTDVQAGKHRAWERFSREALDLAGARSQPFRVWLEDWQVVGGPAGPWRLVAAADDARLELDLQATRPPVLQGDRGLSRKGSQPGNASYYYSLTRLETRGHVQVGGERHPVTGLSWMDREWSTSALEPGQVGWDWFSLQLSDGSDLMLYQLRRTDGTADPASSGSLADAPAGSGVTVPRPFAAADMRLLPRGTWRDPEGTRWPVRWRIEIPREDLVLDVEPWLEAQKMDLSVPYWEGAIRARGTRRGRPVEGRGYLELTGYSSASRQVPPGPSKNPGSP